jgi:ribokinase
MNQPCVLSIGSLNLDLELRVERLPGPDDESITGRDLLVSGGGRAANVAFLARKIGTPAVLLARMGQDDLGAIALRGLERIGVDLRYVRRIPGEATGVAMIAVRPNGEETMLYVANANEHWDPQDGDTAEAAIDEAGAARCWSRISGRRPSSCEGSCTPVASGASRWSSTHRRPTRWLRTCTRSPTA